MTRYLLSLIILISSTSAWAQWTKLNGPYGGNVTALTHTTNGKTLALVDSYPFISSNEGVSWTEVSGLGSVYTIIADGNTLYAADYSQFYRSTDGGAMWTPINQTYFQYPTAGIHKVSTDVFIVSGYYGTWISFDAGVNWTQINDNEVYSTAVSPAGDIYQLTYDRDLEQYVIRRHLFPGDGVSWSDEGFEIVLDVSLNYNSKIAFQNNTPFVAVGYDIYKSNTGDYASWFSAESNISCGYGGSFAIDSNGTLYYFTGSYAYSTTAASGGAFWSTITSPSNNTPNCAINLGANKILVGVYDDGTYLTTDGGATWNVRSTGFDSGTGYAIEAGSDGTLYARVGGYSAPSIWRSTDSGLNWTYKGTPNSFHNLFMTSSQSLIGYGYSSTYRSVNKADSWTFVTNYLMTIVELSTGKLYASTNQYQASNYLRYSPDDGVTWQNVTISGIPAGTSDYTSESYVAALNSNTLFLFVNNDHSSLGYHDVYKIQLSGATTATATLMYSVTEDFDYRNFFVLDGKVYLATNNDVFYSDDQGATWDSFSFQSSAVFPITGGICLSSNGTAYITQDDGKSFSSGALPKSDSYLTDIAEDINGDFFSVGYRSVALKNTAELVVDPETLPPYIDFDWQPVSGPYGGNNFSLFKNPATGNLLSRTSNGTMYTSANAGSTPWQPVEENGFCSGCAYDLKYTQNGTLYAVTYWDLYKSTNNGASWSYIENNESISYKQRIFPFSNGSLAMFRYNNGVMEAYRSDDEGQTYGSPVTNFGSNLSIYTSFVTVNDVAFFIYYSYTSQEYITYRSTDYGASWQQIALAVENSTALTSDDFGNIYVRGGSEIFVSADNGDNWQDISGNITSVANSLAGYTLWISPTGDIYVAGFNNSDYSQGLFVSTDQGVTWNFTGEIPEENSVYDLRDIHWQGSKMVLAFYYGIITSNDGGATFQSAIEGITDLSFENIELFGNSKLQVYGNNGVYESNDLDTWSKRNDFYSIKTLKLNDGSLLGYSGNYSIRKTIDNGQTWTTVSTSMPEGYAPNHIVTYNGTLFYALANNKIYSTTDFINWTKLNITGMPSNPNINEIAAFSSGRIYFVHYNNADSKNELYRVQFSSAVKLNVGQDPQNVQLYNGGLVVYDRSGGLYFSANGTTWTLKGAPGNGSKLILFSDNYWFVPTSNNARLWLSRDQGSTWQNIGMNTDQSSQRFTDVVINPFDGYAYATVTNSPVRKSANVVIVDDGTAPQLTGFTPANQSTGIGERPELTLTFDEPVLPTADFKLRIIDAFDYQAKAVIDAEADLVQSEGMTLTYKPSTALDFGKEYFVIVDEKVTDPGPPVVESGTFRDIFGNPFDGFLDENIWRFTTRSAPTLTSLSPADGSTDVSNSPTLTLTFSEPMEGVAGKHINVHYSFNPSNPAFQIDAATGVSDGNTLSFELSEGLDFNTQYIIKAEAGAFKTPEGGTISVVMNNTDWNLTTGAQPNITGLEPSQDETNVFLSPEFTITFEELVTAEDGYNLYIYDFSNNLFETIPASSVTQEGNSITFTLSSGLNYGTSYYVTADYGFFRANGIVVNVLNGTYWSFTTESTPSLGTTIPANNAVGVELNTTFSMTFSSDVIKEAGKSMYIVDEFSSVVHTVNIDNDVTINGNVATFSIPALTLDFNVQYHIVADADAFSANDIPFSVLQSTFDWVFTTRDLPTYTTSPITHATGVGLNENFVINFTGPVTPAPGFNFYIYDITEAGNEFLAATIDVATINFTGNSGVIPVPTLAYGRTYSFESDNWAFLVSGIEYDVFNDTGDWRFTTVDPPFVVNTTATGSPSPVLEIEFSEPVSCVPGTFARIYEDGSLVGTAINLSGLESDNNDVLTITPAFKLRYGRTYNIVFDAGAFETADGVPFSVLTSAEWQYSTIQPPSVSSTSPANSNTNVGINTSLSVTLSEAFTFAPGKFVRVFLNDGSGTEVAAVDLTTLSPASNTNFTIPIGETLGFNTQYYVVFDADAFVVNQVPFTRLADDNDWIFTTRNPPTVSSVTPGNSTGSISLNTSLSVTLSEAFTFASGKFARVYLNDGSNTEITAIDLTSIQTSPSTTASFPVGVVLGFNTQYKVKFDEGAFVFDQATFTRLSGDNDWTFTTRTAPTVSSVTPGHSTGSISLNTSLGITLSDPFTFASGKFARVYINDGSNTEVAAINLTNILSSANVTATFPIGVALDFNTQYEIRFDEGAFVFDQASFTRLSGDNEWIFTTRNAPTVTARTPANNTQDMDFTPSVSLTFTDPVTVTGTVIYYQGTNAVAESQLGVVSGNQVTFAWDAANNDPLPGSTTYNIKPTVDAFSFQGRSFSVLTGNNEWVATTKDVLPPTLTFSAPASFSSQGSNKLEITVTEQGGGQVASVLVFHRGLAAAASSNFASDAMTFNSASGKYEINVPSGWLDGLGLEYYFSAADNRTPANQATLYATGTTPYKTRITLPTEEGAGQEVPNLSFGGDVGDYRIFAVPYTFNGSNSVAVSTVFAELADLDSKVDYRLVTYNKTKPAGWALYDQDFTNIQRGTGYWFNSKEQIELTIEGGTTPPETRDSPFAMTLVNGWNQIGNPYPFDIDWSDIADTNPDIGDLYKYTGSYTTSNQTLRKFEGGFVFFNGSGSTQVPIPFAAATGSRVKREQFAAGWYLPVSITQGNVSNDYTAIGMHADATIGYDKFDNINPPRFIQYLEANFAHPEHQARSFAKDIVPLTDEHTWEFTIASNLAENAIFTWDFPEGSEFAWDLYLYDVALARPVNMRTEHSYSFNPRESSTFKVYYGKNAAREAMPQMVVLGVAYPNPSSGIISIPVSLPDEGGNEQAVEVVMIDALGRMLGKVAQGTFTAGYHELMVDGTKKFGTVGLYTYQVKVTNDKGNEVLHGKVMIKK